MKILLVFAGVCIGLHGFCQKGDYLIKNNGDTIWGDITLKNKYFYVNGTTTPGIKAEDIAKMIFAASQLSAQACVEDIILRPQLGDL